MGVAAIFAGWNVLCSFNASTLMASTFRGSKRVSGTGRSTRILTDLTRQYVCPPLLLQNWNIVFSLETGIYIHSRWPELVLTSNAFYRRVLKQFSRYRGMMDGTGTIVFALKLSRNVIDYILHANWKEIFETDPVKRTFLT